MDNLPPELLRGILLSSVHLSRSEKNVLLPLRLVNKRFDFILREYMFKTVQLDFSRFARGETAPQMSSLADVGHLCQSLYCDMMVIRDEGTLCLASYPWLHVLLLLCQFCCEVPHSQVACPLLQLY
jgi:hypothetical protein